MMKLVLKDR